MYLGSEMDVFSTRLKKILTRQGRGGNDRHFFGELNESPKRIQEVLPPSPCCCPCNSWTFRSIRTHHFVAWILLKQGEAMSFVEGGQKEWYSWLTR